MAIPFLSNLRHQLRVWKEIRSMSRAVDALASGPSLRRGGTVQRLLIVPSDPWTLVGAKGDEAMMQGVVKRLRDASPDLRVGVLTATPAAQSAARALGFEPVDAWTCPMAEGLRTVHAFAPDALAVVGADVMDGYYSPLTTARMLLTAESIARAGARVCILGFSFNERPHPWLKVIFDRLSPTIAVNVRDQLSLDRFQRFTRAKARLVTDSAFLLAPDDAAIDVAAVANWAASRRQAGDAVIGFNIHPMLIRNATPEQVQGLVRSAVEALREVCSHRAASVVLISHDYRGHESDDACLAPIFQALSAELGHRLTYPTARLSAAQLKAVAGCTDGVVTGRMHLAIATLGTGKPVAALTYQDKFQGLFRHFDYPEHYLLGPTDSGNPARLAALVTRFVDELEPLRQRVHDHRPAVIAASVRNLAIFADPVALTASTPKPAGQPVAS